MDDTKPNVTPGRVRPGLRCWQGLGWSGIYNWSTFLEWVIKTKKLRNRSGSWPTSSKCMTPAKAKAQCMNFLAKAEVAAAAAIALPPPTTNTLGQESIFGSFFWKIPIFWPYYFENERLSPKRKQFLARKLKYIFMVDFRQLPHWSNTASFETKLDFYYSSYYLHRQQANLPRSDRNSFFFFFFFTKGHHEMKKKWNHFVWKGQKYKRLLLLSARRHSGH